MMPTSLSKPRLLLISHCLPEPCGDHHSARAWQLLQLARESHEVDLACHITGQVNLRDWRIAASMTRKLNMDTPALTRQLMCQVTSFINPPGAIQKQWQDTLSQSTQTLADEQAYDAVICTHPALWELARNIDARQRVCDINGAAAGSFGILNTPAMTGFTSWSLSAWQSSRSRRHHEVIYHSLTRECDVITASNTSLCDSLSAQTHSVYHLPRAVDLSWFKQESQDAATGEHSPLLMLHTDERVRSGRAQWEWFGRQVWRKVQQAVPNAQWVKRSVTSQQGSMLDSLRRASVIVSPQLEPESGQWAALQSMAMSRPVIASGHAVADLGVRHGEHLLMSRKPSDWVELCVESLRSATVRLKLAQAGRAFVETHCPLDSNHNLFANCQPKLHTHNTTQASSLTHPPLAMAA